MRHNTLSLQHIVETAKRFIYYSSCHPCTGQSLSTAQLLGSQSGMLGAEGKTAHRPLSHKLERMLTTMCDAGMAAHIWTQGDQRVELLPLAVVQAEHIMQESCVQKRGKLQHCKRLSSYMQKRNNDDITLPRVKHTVLQHCCLKAS